MALPERVRARLRSHCDLSLPVVDRGYGALVRSARLRRGLDQRELARQLGVAPLLIRKIEDGHLLPNPEVRLHLQAVLDVRPADAGAGDPVELADTMAQPAAGGDDDVLTRPLDSGPPVPRAASGYALVAAESRKRGYLLEQQIGEGGFGTVWRATQLSVGRDVAIKVVRPEMADDADFIRRFELEARLVARLEHPHIVPLYDYWREPGAAFMVMRWLRGGSLAARLTAGAEQGLPPLNLLPLLRQVGQALEAAHRAGIVHRDLKPANILLDDDGNACLADFGIARQIGGDGSNSQPGEIVGSIAYCAPEQLRGETVSPRTDVYAFGLLCFELVTGRRPFQGATGASLIQKHLYETPPPARDWVADLPLGLDAAIAQALRKDPEQRPRSVLELLDAIELAVRSGLNNGWAGRVACGHALTPGNTTGISALTQQSFRDLDNPYLGLAAFGEGDAANFFGREAVVEQLLAKLADRGPLSRALFVVGASGSGKSSVVRAGLIPALRANAVPGSARWLIADLRPGSDPLAALAQALARVSVRAGLDLDALVRSDVRGFGRAIDRCLPTQDGCELLLLVDQFEELFTQTADESLRTAFIDAVTSALLDPHSQLRMVFTLRADFLDRPLKYADLGALLGERNVLVPAMSLDELERAIVGPARRLGLRFEDGLVAAILEEAGHQAGTLPLLQYALSELFLRRDHGLLTLAAFRSSGGIRGALAGRADAAWLSLDESGQEAAKQLVLRLTTLGEGSEDTRRRVGLSELMALGHGAGGPAALEEALSTFSAARLLTFDRDARSGERTVEVAHEALLRSWNRLRDWLAAARADLRLQRQLALAASEWRAAGCDDSFLLTGNRLHALRPLADGSVVRLSEGENQFLCASLEAVERQVLIEQQRSERELKQVRELAAQQQAAADSQRRGNRRLRWLVAGLATVLFASLWLGWLLKSRGDQLALATERAELEALSARSLSEFWARLFATADPNLSRGKGVDLKVVDVLAAGLEQVPLALKDAPSAQSRLLLALGRSFRQLASYEQAQSALEQAVAAQMRASDVTAEERIELKLEMGRLQADRGQMSQAIATLKDAERLQMETGAPPLSQATTLNILASIYNETSRLAEAEPLLRRALALRRQHGAGRNELASSINNLAFTLQTLGQVAEARPLFEEALAMRLDAQTEPSLSTAILRMNIATSSRDLGEFGRARAQYAQVDQDLTILLGADKPHPVRASLLQHQGQLAALQDDYPQALALLDAAVAMQAALNNGKIDAPALQGVRRIRAAVRQRSGAVAAARVDHDYACAAARARAGEMGLDWGRCQLREAELRGLEAQAAAAVLAPLDEAIRLLGQRSDRDLRAGVELARALRLRAQWVPAGAVADLAQAAALLDAARDLVIARKLVEVEPRSIQP